MIDFTAYKTLVFDCDGVVTNTNQIKIQAYYDTAINFGADATQAQALVDHHIHLGGISRFIKFEYFLKAIMQRPVSAEAVQWLLDEFGRLLEYELLHCELAPNLLALKAATPDARWMLVSGGDQLELRKLFEQRDIAHLFEAGIFGSPDNKDTILAREKSSANLIFPAIFLGDSRYDHQASTRAGLDFVFLSDWTDFDGWQGYCQEHQILVMPSLPALI